MFVETWNGHKQTPTWFVLAGDYPVCLRVGDDVISRSSNDPSPPDSSIQLALSSFFDFLFEHFIHLTSISLFFLLLNWWRHCFFSCIFHFDYVHMKRNVLVARNHIWKITLAIAFVVSAISAFPTIESLWWSYDKGKCSLGNYDFLSCLLTFTNWKYVMGAFTWLLSWCRIWHAWNRKCNKWNKIIFLKVVKCLF